MVIENILEVFPEGTVIRIEVVLPGEYRVGFDTPNWSYRPGFGSYYPIEEGLTKAAEIYKDLSTGHIKRKARGEL